MRIDVIVPTPGRRWHRLLVERLESVGHAVAITPVAARNWLVTTRAVIALESRILHRPNGLASTTEIRSRPREGEADLIIDLAGAPPSRIPTLRIAFDGSTDDSSVLATIAAGRLPDIETVLDGRTHDRAQPMVDNRIFVAAGAEDVFARAVTLTVKSVARIARGDRATTPFSPRDDQTVFGPAYLRSAVPRILREAARRRRYRYAHWRVGYRLHDGPGIAETGALGNGWSVLPDDGTRFYADPFPFEHDGTRYIFVEDYPHVTRKAVLSVSTLDAEGVAGPPAPILEEPHHLSYPQVFVHEGDIWMLPEGGAGGRLTLYRAERFPDRWVPVANLLDGTISDATLLRHDGRFWIVATDRDGAGSTSDTLVVFHAPSLTGPWTPHRQNPIMIDRRRARPGGAFAAVQGGLLLPTQDGTLGYGAGLGLAPLLRLDEDSVELGEPQPISPTGDFPHPQIHTLNRAGRLEVIDGIAAVPKH